MTAARRRCRLIDFATDLIRAGSGLIGRQISKAPDTRRTHAGYRLYEQRCNLDRAMNANVEKAKWQPTPFQIMSRPKW